MEKIRIVATSDAHIGKLVPQGQPQRRELFLQTMDAILAERPSIIIYCGDATDQGLPKEAQEAAVIFDLAQREHIPIFMTLGNHDHWGRGGRHTTTVKRILEQEGGATVLDGQAITLEIEGRKIGITGVEGYGEKSDEVNGEIVYCDRRASRNSTIIADEIAKLKDGLTHLEGDSSIVVLHYPPATLETELATIIGEPLELQQRQYLGSDRLGAAIDKYNATSSGLVRVIFHGHLDSGSPHGKTKGGIDVYNVSAIARERRGLPPYQIVEL